MDTVFQAPSRAGWQQWTGRILSALVVLLLIVDGGAKLALLAPVLAAQAELGYAAQITRPIGWLVLACAALYAWPRTSVLGAILLTGLLGGAVASHVRIGSPWSTHVLFGVYVGLAAWLGLWLRDKRLRAFVPLKPR